MPQLNNEDTQLLAINIEALNEGRELLASLDRSHYTSGYKPAFHSTIGAHFRHLLEHYRCFLAHLDGGELNYDGRERDQLLETDIDYARDTIQQLIEILTAFKRKPEASLTLKAAALEGCVQTSMARELVFLQSHTVHHYAIIGAMVRVFGESTADDFGIAIATRQYNEESGQKSPIGETPPCAQ